MATAVDLDTRTALVSYATELIQVRGFCAFSYLDLANRVGIRTASIHHHFPTKADLGVAVVRSMATHMSESWTELERLYPNVTERLRALFAHVQGLAARGDRICPAGSLQAEFNALPATVQVQLQAFDEEYLATYTRWLDTGRRAGELVYPGSPRDMAQVVVSVLQAGLQRHRANPAESVDDLLTQLLRLLGIASLSSTPKPTFT